MRTRFRYLCAGIIVFASASSLIMAGTSEVAESSGEQAAVRLAFPGEYVRHVENGQVVVNLGYRTANGSVGQQWLMVEVSMTVTPGNNMTLKRDDFWLTTPDGTKVLLATQEEFNKAAGAVRALDARANIARDSLNYVPKRADIPCRIGFFADATSPNRGLAFSQFSMSPDSYCAGRLYFVIPDGIEYGRHFLNIQLPGDVVQVPFKIMTKEELKEAKAMVKQWEQEQKQLAKEEKQKAKEAKKQAKEAQKASGGSS